MRNYFKTRAMQWRAFIFDDLHNPAGDFPVYGIGQNDVELKQQVDIKNNAIATSLPANWTAEFTYDRSAFDLFFLLDKDAFMVIAHAFDENFVSDAVANQPPFYPVLVNPKTSPRYTGWKDPDGVTRKAAPSDKKGARGDFSGAQGLIDFVNNLPAYAAILKREGRLRDSGIVLEVYNEIIAQKISVTEGLAILRQNGL